MQQVERMVNERPSIRKARRYLVDPLTHDGQISIEHNVVERAQFDLYHRGVLCDGARKLKKRQETYPGGMCIGGRKIVITRGA